jgi:trehalose-6-phosphate synthase
VRRSPSDLHYQERKLIVKDFPVGIDPDVFKRSIASEETKKEMNFLTQAFCGRKVLLGVDRLDYIKGIPQKLRAFDKFLDAHPEWIEKLLLVQIAIPTRSEVSDYKALRSEVEELVGMVNGKHGIYIHYS